jgi:AmmeMemoRadiSam system protein B
MADLRVRPPAVAGTFYPADRDELVVEMRRAFGGARVVVDAGEVPKAVVAPHAGYVYSGPVAATAYAALRPLRGVVTRVVLLGPSHRVPFAGLAVPTADVLATPLGDVRVDAAGRDAVRGLPGVVVWDEPHDGEHSLEVHLPFIIDVLGDVGVLPIVVGDAPAKQVAAVLDAVWGGPETVIVVSSDLSHYHPHDEAVVLDRATAEAIEAGRPGDIGPYDACGAYPVRGLLVAGARHGLRAHAVDLRTSGDTAGPRDRVVGYGAFVFT